MVFGSRLVVGIQWLAPANDRRLGHFARSFFIGPAFRRRFRQPECQMVSEKPASGTEFGPAGADCGGGGDRFGGSRLVSPWFSACRAFGLVSSNALDEVGPVGQFFTRPITCQTTTKYPHADELRCSLEQYLVTCIHEATGSRSNTPDSRYNRTSDRARKFSAISIHGQQIPTVAVASQGLSGT